eukprot:tig00000350_g24347.t1
MDQASFDAEVKRLIQAGQRPEAMRLVMGRLLTDAMNNAGANRRRTITDRDVHNAVSNLRMSTAAGPAAAVPPSAAPQAGQAGSSGSGSGAASDGAGAGAGSRKRPRRARSRSRCRAVP